MKIFYNLLTLSTCLLVSIFGCQSENSTNTISEADIKPVDTFYLDINLPETAIDSLLKSSRKQIDIDIYLKTKTDSSGVKSYVLSIDKTQITFDEFGKLFDMFRYNRNHNHNTPKNNRARQVANLYIDKTAPYYLVDYIQKRLASSHQLLLSFVNKQGQKLWHKNPPLYHPIWEVGLLPPAPPLPPPPPKINEEKDVIFSKNYLATLKRFGIDQKPIKKSGLEQEEAMSIKPKNIFKLKLNASNQLILRDSLVSLDEALELWQDFMKDETLWNKRITACTISGEVDYAHFFECYSSIRGAFQRKRNQLAIDLFGKNMSELELASKRAVANKLPFIIITDLDD